MKRLTYSLYIVFTLCVFFGIPLTLPGAPAPEKSLPVAPVSAIDFLGWEHAYRLANDDLSVIAVPDIGRIIFIGPNENSNLLSVNESLQGTLPSATNTQNWMNFGGDWLFPVAQQRWPDFQGSDWPPSRLLDGRAWTGRAWKNSDNTQCCLLQQEYGAPLHIKVSRLITIPPQGLHFTVEQRIERMQESSIPVTLWNITQLSNPNAVFFPTDDSGTFTNGYHIMMGQPPASNCLTFCEDSIAYDTSCGSEVKFGSSSTERWVAGSCSNVYLVEYARSNNRTGAFPDGGCSIEIYANKGLGYAEIENLSIEKSLNPGESLANTLHFHVVAFSTNNIPTPCNFIKTVRSISPGEKSKSDGSSPSPSSK